MLPDPNSVVEIGTQYVATVTINGRHAPQPRVVGPVILQYAIKRHREPDPTWEGKLQVVREHIRQPSAARFGKLRNVIERERLSPIATNVLGEILRNSFRFMQESTHGNTVLWIYSDGGWLAESKK